MSLSYKKDELYHILQDLEILNMKKHSFTNLENYIVKWMRVRSICNQILTNNNLLNQDGSLFEDLLDKFENQVKPKLLVYLDNKKKNSLKENLSSFSKHIEDTITSAENKFVKNKYKEAKEIYENCLSYIKLNTLLFDKSVINASRIKISKLMSIVTEEIQKIPVPKKIDLFQDTLHIAKKIQINLQNKVENLKTTFKKRKEDRILKRNLGKKIRKLKRNIRKEKAKTRVHNFKSNLRSSLNLNDKKSTEPEISDFIDSLDKEFSDWEENREKFESEG